MSKKRNFQSNEIYHIYSRGSKKELIYFDDNDYYRFITKLKKYAKISQNQIIQYVLLPNHFHLLVKAKNKKSIPSMMMRLLTSHSKYICSKYHFIGSIFQSRYKAKLVNDLIYLLIVSRYIHRNPMEYFEIHDTFEEYRWSSYREYLATNLLTGLIDLPSKKIITKHFPDLEFYKEFVELDEIKALELLKNLKHPRRKVGAKDWVDVGG
jgi:putative transposase